MATTRIAMSSMKPAQTSKPGADSEIVEREIPKPGVGQVRIKVQACGVCHSDVVTKEGQWPKFSIRAYQDTKSPASSMNWVRMFRRLRWDSVPAGDFRKCRNLKIPGAVGPLSLPMDTRQLCLREHV